MYVTLLLNYTNNPCVYTEVSYPTPERQFQNFAGLPFFTVLAASLFVYNLHSLKHTHTPLH